MAHSSAFLSLSKQIGYTFKNESLLEQALTHRSVGSKNNERLEFLGDSILNFVIADALFQQFPENSEGDLSRLRAHLVNGDTLADIARDLKLGDFLRLGAGELKSGGFKRDSILADAVESILGAIYTDSDLAVCKKIILNLYVDLLKDIPDPQQLKDAKTQLQELLQARKIPIPVYKVIRISGKAHDQNFDVECVIESLGVSSQGIGHSRRKAEQLAAKAAIPDVLKKLG